MPIRVMEPKSIVANHPVQVWSSLSIEHQFKFNKTEYRIEAFVQKLLTDENDARAAQLETLPGQWPSHLLLTVFDQSDYIALDADAQAMPPGIQKNQKRQTIKTKV